MPSEASGECGQARAHLAGVLEDQEVELGLRIAERRLDESEDGEVMRLDGAEHRGLRGRARRCPDRTEAVERDSKFGRARAELRRSLFVGASEGLRRASASLSEEQGRGGSRHPLCFLQIAAVRPLACQTSVRVTAELPKPTRRL